MQKGNKGLLYATDEIDSRTEKKVQHRKEKQCKISPTWHYKLIKPTHAENHTGDQKEWDTNIHNIDFVSLAHVPLYCRDNTRVVTYG